MVAIGLKTSERQLEGLGLSSPLVCQGLLSTGLCGLIRIPNDSPILGGPEVVWVAVKEFKMKVPSSTNHMIQDISRSTGMGSYLGVRSSQPRSPRRTAA